MIPFAEVFMSSMRRSTRCSSSPGGSMLPASLRTRTRQVEQRPRPPHTWACGIPASRLASSTLVPGVTSTKRPSA